VVDRCCPSGPGGLVAGAILARMPESNVLAVNAAGTVVHATLALAALAAAMRRAT
jgi:hypothetical protein